MAPATSTSTGNGAPTALPINPQPTSAGFAGDEFSNNLFSDLAPLLTLFGGQVTKQFLSMSMGWADHIMLGMGPLGVITAVVSAIRVSGVSKLKALIGRARESRTSAEIELLSSTSDNVCELWNGREFVRLAGRPKILEFVCFEDQTGVHIRDLFNAVNQGLMISNKSQDSGWLEELVVEWSSAPNLALNAGSIASAYEKWTLAIIAIAIQSVALVIPAISTYRWHWNKGSQDAQGLSWGFIVLLVIDVATEECDLVPTGKGKLGSTFFIQKSCTIGDQEFPNTLIVNNEDNRCIRISRLRDIDKEVRIMSVLATILAIGGFICQFVGLRALHWSATIIQLGATLLMTGIRSWVRRGLADKYSCRPLSSDPDEISMALGFRCIAQAKQEPKAFDRSIKFGRIYSTSWKIPTANDLRTWRGPPWNNLYGDFPKMKDDNLPMKEDPMITIRSMLQQFCTNQDPLIHLAEHLYTAFSSTLKLWKQALRDEATPYPTEVRESKTLSWLLPVLSWDFRLELCHEGLLRLNCREDGWFGPPKEKLELHAMLSMWLTTLRYEYTHDRPPYLRVLGHWSRYSLPSLEHLPRWVGTSLPVEPIPVTNGERSSLGPHRVDYASIVRGYDELFGQSLYNHRKVDTSLSPDAFKSIMEDRPSEYHTDNERNLEPDEAEQQEEKRGCLYFVSNLSLETQCALEIFSGLVQAMADSITSLGELTSPEEIAANPDKAVHGSDLLHSMSKALVASKLVPNIEEANAIIVPPFARRGLLDRKPELQIPAADAPGDIFLLQDSEPRGTKEAGEATAVDRDRGRRSADTMR